LHCEHEEEAARGRCWEMGDSEEEEVFEEEVDVSFGGGGGCGGDGGGAWLGPRGIMVLFLKQVHLQNVGAAA
jgi:hypothetical protein